MTIEVANVSSQSLAEYEIQVKVTNVIPTAGRNLGMGRALPTQMLRRCGWLSMTFSEQSPIV